MLRKATQSVGMQNRVGTNRSGDDDAGSMVDAVVDSGVFPAALAGVDLAKAHRMASSNVVMTKHHSTTSLKTPIQTGRVEEGTEKNLRK